MRRWLLLLVAALAAVVPAAGPARATAPPSPTSTSPLEAAPALERPLEDCISAVPLPDCGFAPEQAGDRGGWMQWTLFGLMIVGLAFIGWRIVRGARRRPSDAR